MKKCLKCGYQRKPEDDKLTPQTECPKCGALYNKIEAYQDKQKKAQIRKEQEAGIEKHLEGMKEPISTRIAGYCILIILCIGIYYLFSSTPESECFNALDAKYPHLSFSHGSGNLKRSGDTLTGMVKLRRKKGTNTKYFVKTVECEYENNKLVKAVCPGCPP